MIAFHFSYSSKLQTKLLCIISQILICVFEWWYIEQDVVGGPTRLSYAQVAQHHKEKVERMLREKQSTEQEKEKEKERKKEGSTTRVAQQHGDVRG